MDTDGSLTCLPAQDRPVDIIEAFLVELSDELSAPKDWEWRPYQPEDNFRTLVRTYHYDGRNKNRKYPWQMTPMCIEIRATEKNVRVMMSIGNLTKAGYYYDWSSPTLLDDLQYKIAEMSTDFEDYGVNQ